MEISIPFPLSFFYNFSVRICVKCRWLWPRGATPHPRPGVAAGRSNLKSKEWWLRGHRGAKRSHPTLKVRKGSSEEIPFVQGKEQWLRFAGTAVRRYPTPRVREPK